MNHKIRSHSVTALKLAVSAGMLWWLFHTFKVDWRDLQERWAGLRWGWAAAGLGAACLMQSLGFVRWWLLLKAEDVRIPFREVTLISLIGGFFGVLSVGVVGQDAARIFYSLKLQPGKKHATVLSIFVDRAIGLFGLIALAAVTLPLAWPVLTSDPRAAAVVWFIVAALASAVAGILPLVLLEIPGPHRKALMWIERLPFASVRERVHESVRAYIGQWRICLQAFFLSVGVHISALLIGYSVVRALAQPIDFLFISGMLPVVNVALSIPVTISGFGVREGLLVLFFKAVQLDAQDALVFSFSLYLLLLVLPLVGALVYVAYRSPGDHVPDEP